MDILNYNIYRHGSIGVVILEYTLLEIPKSRRYDSNHSAKLKTP